MYPKEVNPFYHTKSWKMVAKGARSRDMNLCVRCLEEWLRGEISRPRFAEMVHHIEPIDMRPDLALNIGNTESLCNAHHNKEHPEKGAPRGGQAKPDMLGGAHVIKI